MVSLHGRPELASPLTSLAPATSSSSTTGNPFAQQLATALEGYLNQSSTGSSLDIQVSPVSGQNSGSSQFLVTVTGGASTPSQTPPTPTSGPTSAQSTTAPGTMEQLFSGGAISPANPNTPAVTAPAPAITEADAYWAAQPPAVQALRNMPAGDAKNALAQKLSNEGYPIDNEIMMQGWDPQTTMMMRQDYGYTWVPTYGSPQIQGPPSGPAPADSIAVTTAFAVGTIQTPDALLLKAEAAGTIST